MKFLVVLGIFSFFNSGHGAAVASKTLKTTEEDQPDLCPRGTSFTLDGCNLCICYPDNGLVDCTRNYCPWMHSQKQMSKSLRTSKGLLCPRGEAYPAEDECNRCYCNPETGGSWCTNLYYCQYVNIHGSPPPGQEYWESMMNSPPASKKKSLGITRRICHRGVCWSY